MSKNKIFNLIAFTPFAFLLFTLNPVAVLAASDGTLPDNVKITTSNDGSSTTVVIDSRSGYSTNIETSCVNGKCIHSAVSKKIDENEIKAQIKKEQEYWDNFWKKQEEIFKMHEKMFQDLWGMSLF